MKVVETSFLVDYLNEQPYTLAYLEAHPHAEYVIPTVALYELYAGALRSTGAETIGTITDALGWAEPVVFNDPAAREAADIRSALLDRGEPIPAPDILIAGIARALEANLIAADDHFSRVPRLDVLTPREE